MLTWLIVSITPQHNPCRSHATLPSPDDRGIAPSLVAAKEKLQRSQLEDKLDHALQQRPKAEELIKGGILREDEAPPS
ncbi:hypothetical protein VKT23_018056 [Stygiomarasmius scandens]|uniref:Uncharacterized protein n=1 Tax=Marasmiellus scandens TaxID=2682957 RepID=A0ABR1IQB6_9AGAR